VGPNDQTFETTPSIEYYSGYDEDGSWTEGSRDASVRFASVPGGTWRLLIEPYAGVYDQSGANPVDFTVTLTRHVASWWLFWVALLVLLPWPLWQFFFGRDTAYSPPRARIP